MRIVKTTSNRGISKTMEFAGCIELEPEGDCATVTVNGYPLTAQDMAAIGIWITELSRTEKRLLRLGGYGAVIA
jgi:hypothetical protein